MKYIIITLNTPEYIAMMNGYSGAELIKTDNDFAVWYCVGLSQQEINAMNVVGLVVMNKPA